MKIPYSISIVILLLLFLCTTTMATILEVKQDGTGDYSSIQEAYDNCMEFDTILVYQGLWQENLVLSGSKRVYLTSNYIFSQDDNDITSSIIDGGGVGCCIYDHITWMEGSVINGFTIQNGAAFTDYKVGGGLYLETSCSILNCIIKNNKAVYGGGIYSSGGQLYLSNTTISNNWSLQIGGGLLTAYGCDVVVDTVNKCDIYLNHSSMGADIAYRDDCTFENFVLDTFTVLQPDLYYYLAYDEFLYPIEEWPISISASKIETANSDLYVDPQFGNNNNNGLSFDEPLKTIDFAYKKIISDSLDPKTIYLADGTYSWDSNKERLPVGGRNYVSLVGESREGVILDADSLGSVFRSTNTVHGYMVKNISFINGNGNYEPYGLTTGVEVYYGYDVVFDSIRISNCSGPVGTGFKAGRGTNFVLCNSIIENNLGNHAVVLWGSNGKNSSFRIENLIVNNNLPNPNGVWLNNGGGVVITGPGGGYPWYMEGQIINSKITNNLHTADPDWGPGAAVGLWLGENVKIDLINSTITQNSVEGPSGYAVSAQSGSELNIYNSILYNNDPAELSAGHSLGSDPPSLINVDYSNVMGGEDGIMNWYWVNEINWFGNNLDEDPIFDLSGDNPFSLQPTSPCINTGVPMYSDTTELPYFKVENQKLILYKQDGDTVHLPATDLAGNKRIVDSQIDMGAYEFQDTITEITLNCVTEINVLNVFPNPSNSGLVAFQYGDNDNHESFELIVCNTYGNIIYSKKISQQGNSIMVNTGSWPKGMYLAALYSNSNQIARAKFLIK